MKCNNCGDDDHRSERCHLASDNFYERGYRAGLKSAANTPPLALRAAGAAGEFAAQVAIAVGALGEIVNYGHGEPTVPDVGADARYFRDVAKKALKEIDRINQESAQKC